MAYFPFVWNDRVVVASYILVVNYSIKLTVLFSCLFWQMNATDALPQHPNLQDGPAHRNTCIEYIWKINTNQRESFKWNSFVSHLYHIAKQGRVHIHHNISQIYRTNWLMIPLQWSQDFVKRHLVDTSGIKWESSGRKIAQWHLGSAAEFCTCAILNIYIFGILSEAHWIL